MCLFLLACSLRRGPRQPACLEIVARMTDLAFEKQPWVSRRSLDLGETVYAAAGMATWLRRESLRPSSLRSVICGRVRDSDQAQTAPEGTTGSRWAGAGRTQRTRSRTALAARLPGAPRLAAGVWAPRPLPALRLCCHLPQLFFPRLACCYGQALISFVPFSLKKKNHYMFFKLEENSGIRRLESGKQRRAARETAPRPQADDGHCATRPGPRRLCRLEGNTQRRRVTLATARARADRRQTRDAPPRGGQPARGFHVP